MTLSDILRRSVGWTARSGMVMMVLFVNVLFICLRKKIILARTQSHVLDVCMAFLAGKRKHVEIEQKRKTARRKVFEVGAW